MASPDARLRRYRSSEFSRTAEPGGWRPPAVGCAALRRPAPPRPAVALRPPLRDRRRAGQLRRAQGSVARPRREALGGPRRGPSDRVPRLRGGDPRGEYGGGDVIVWDLGTWGLHGADDARAAIESGELHADMHGEKLRGRLVLVRRYRRRARARAVAAVPQARRVRRRRMGPRGAPRVGRSGRTNDEVAARPRRRVAERSTGRDGRELLRPAGATPDEIEPSTRWAEGLLGDRRPRAAADEPRQGAVPGPRRRGSAHQARPPPLPRHGGTAHAAAPHASRRRSPPLPRRCRPTRLLAQAIAVTCARMDHTMGQPRRGRRARPRRTSWPTRPPRWRGWPTSAPSSSTLGRPGRRGPLRLPTYALFDVDPGHGDGVGRACSRWRGCIARRWSTSAFGGSPRSRAAGASRSWCRSCRGIPSPTSQRGSMPSPGPSAQWCRSSRAGAMEEGRPRWACPARRHAERDQQDAGRPLRRPRRGGGAGVGTDHLGRVDDPDLRPDRWTIRTILERVLEVGDLYGDLAHGRRQELPDLGLSPS